MNKQITLSILTSGLLFLAGCGSDSTASIPQENQVVQQSSSQSFSPLETRHIGVNNAPVACAKTFCTNKDTNLTAQLIATDEDDDVLTYAISDLNITKGSIDLNASSGAFNYSPAEGFVGTYTFNFTATDEHDANDTEVITIIVQEQDVSMLKPSAPTDLAVNDSTLTSIQLTWIDTSDNESGFVIYKDGVVVKCVGENQQSVWISGLNEGESYEFTIKAKNTAGCSDFSNSVTATTLAATVAPAAPTNLEVVAQNKTCVKLKWEDNADNESGFRIYNQADELIKIVSANCKCTTISGLNAGEEYTFKIVAFNSVGESTTAEVTTTMDPNVNSVPVAQSKTYCTYEDTNLTGQLCAYDADGDALTYAIVDSSTGTIDLNVTTGQFVYAPVAGFTGVDTFTFTASDETNTSEVKTVTIKICEVAGSKPVAPTELNVTVDATNFYLTWVDNSDNEDDFRIFRNGNHIATVGADETNVTIAIDDLDMTAKYRFEVRAFNSYDCSDAAVTECKVWMQP